MSVKLHPAAKAFNDWLNTPEGKIHTEGVTVDVGLHGHYMENRCRRAFNAGWRACDGLIRSLNKKAKHGQVRR